MFWLEVVQFIAVVILFILVLKSERNNFNKNKEIAALQKEIDELKYLDSRRDFMQTAKINHAIDILLTTLNKINKNYRVTNSNRMGLLIFFARFIEDIDKAEEIKINTNKYNTYKSASEPLYEYINNSLYLKELTEEQNSEILSAIYYLVTK